MNMYNIAFPIQSPLATCYIEIQAKEEAEAILLTQKELGINVCFALQKQHLEQFHMKKLTIEEAKERGSTKP